MNPRRTVKSGPCLYAEVLVQQRRQGLRFVPLDRDADDPRPRSLRSRTMDFHLWNPGQPGQQPPR